MPLKTVQKAERSLIVDFGSVVAIADALDDHKPANRRGKVVFGLLITPDLEAGNISIFIDCLRTGLALRCPIELISIAQEARTRVVLDMDLDDIARLALAGDYDSLKFFRMPHLLFANPTRLWKKLRTWFSITEIDVFQYLPKDDMLYVLSRIDTIKQYISKHASDQAPVSPPTP